MIPWNIWIINLSGFLCNISTSLIFGISASFLRTIIGLNPADIGLFQGIVDASSFGTKLTAGFFSDFFRKRRMLIIVGIILVTISKPMLALATSLPLVFAARILDRVGNGIQSTPRDALLADLCSEDMRGRCYGLRNVLTILGSVIGSLLGIKLMLWTNNHFQSIFFLASIPAFLSLLVAIIFIPDSFSEKKEEKKSFVWSDLKILGAQFWKFIAVCFVFFIFRYNETILAVKATEELGLSHAYSAVVFLVYNIAICTFSYPFGLLSDKFPKERILLYCFFISICGHLCCGFASSLIVLFLGIILWGAQMGAGNAVLFSLTASYAPLHLRGTAFSIFFLTNFLATIISSLVFRCFCYNYGLNTPFLIGSFGVSFAALLLYLFFCRYEQNTSTTPAAV